MKHMFFIAALAGAIVFTSLNAHAQNSPLTVAPGAVAGKEQAALDKHIKPILAALKLKDEAKEAQVHDILAGHLQALNAWHAAHDAQTKPLWNDFNHARSKHNEADADAALAKIDEVYASFKPQHEQLIKDLSPLLSPDQIETVKNVLTINKVKITFHAYGEIFHGLTDEQKTFILKNLKAAREEAIDAVSMTEKSAFFKKYKIRIEAYLTAQGYDVKQSYRDFITRQKAEAAAKKAGSASAPADQDGGAKPAK